jgi:hypothetical protein
VSKHKKGWQSYERHPARDLDSTVRAFGFRLTPLFALKRQKERTGEQVERAYNGVSHPPFLIKDLIKEVRWQWQKK